MARDWRFTEARKRSLKRARDEHSYIVKLGKLAKARGMRLSR